MATGCISIGDQKVIDTELVYLKGFCSAYQQLRDSEKYPFFFNRFSLRDFYHLLRYFRRKSLEAKSNSVIINPELTLQSLERNFNGVSQEEFKIIVDTFFENIEEIRKKENHIHTKPFKKPERAFRTQIECLRDSLQDRYREKENVNDTSVRFKLVIDQSDDDSGKNKKKQTIF